MERAGYEIPAAAGGDQGLEGFDVRVGGERVGRVAALNATAEGLVLLVDDGGAYRPVAASFVACIETVGHAVALTAEGEAALAAAPRVEPLVRRADSPRLVRHLPRALDPLLTAGERRETRRSRLWYAGVPLVGAGGVGSMAGPVLAADGVGGAVRWLWVAVPVAALAAGVALLWRAYGRDSPQPLSTWDTLADALAFVWGISPRTRRRG